MASARADVLGIVDASKRVVNAATEYARRRGLRDIQSSGCQIRLEREMQKISVTAGGILGVLSESSLQDGLPLDDRLQDWLSADEPRTCLDTLHQMETMLLDNTWMNAIFNFVNVPRSAPPEDRIIAVLKLFDSRISYFHFLMTTDVWNREDTEQHSAVLSAESAHRLLEPNIDTTEVEHDYVIVSTGEIRATNDPPETLDDILKWLNALSCAAKQEETLSLRQPDTCIWLHSAPVYKRWRDNVDSYLWLQGKPGSGKTVLTSFLVDSLQYSRHTGEVLAFFYCDFRNDRSTSAAEVIRSLLSQLLHHMHNENLEPGEWINDLIGRKNSDTPILDNVEQLAAFVSQTAKQFSHQPLIVVDALDECNDVEKLLDGLLILAEGGMRLFVTSRPLQIIKDVLCGLPTISMDSAPLSTDIALHVTRELDSSSRLRTLDPHFKTEIHFTLCDKADGMFRWVQCQINTLNRCTTKAEVRQALNNLPIGLDETYQRILDAIDTGSLEGKLALRGLTWLVGALRPTRLVEILEGLTIDVERRTMDPEYGAMYKDALLHTCGSLVTYNESTDILILSHFSVKEYLIGDLTRIKFPRYHIDYRSAHEHLARICIYFISLYLKYVHESGENVLQPGITQMIIPRSQRTSMEMLQLPNDPPAVFSVSQDFLDYVFTDGFNHLAYLDSTNYVVLNDMGMLRSDIERYPAAWEKIRQILQSCQGYAIAVPWPSSKHDFMFYILTAFASDSLLRAFVDHTGGILQPKDRTNPLVYAAHFGKPEHIALLLSCGAEVNERGLSVDGTRHALPIEIAVGRRHDAVVALLLPAGSTIPNRLFGLSTYYYKFPAPIVRMLLETDQFVKWAAEPGNELPSPLRILQRRPPLVYEADIISIIRRLIQVGVDHTEHDSGQRTALYFAILGGYRAIVSYLLSIGTPFPPDFISIISRLASSERIPMLRTVIEAGIDVDVHTGSNCNMLHIAVASFKDDSDCLEAVKILVGAGCQPYARDDAGRTPLHIALEKRSCSAANYLLSRGGTPKSDVLLAVVESGCPATWRLENVRALITRGAVIHGTTRDKDVLLHQGTDNQGPETAELPGPLWDLSGHDVIDYILQTGGPPPTDALFVVLRSAASPAWKSLIVYSLIGKGADVHALSEDGSTLLHAALLAFDERLGLDVVKLLVGAGCEPLQTTADGITPLHTALNRQFPLIAEYLLPTWKPLTSDILSAILHSALPAAWRAKTILHISVEGIDKSGLSADGNTLLHSAILSLDESKALDVVQFLVEAGCNPSQRSADGNTPLHIALDRKFSIIAEDLLSAIEPSADTLFAILNSGLPEDWRAEVTYSLIEGGTDVHGVSVNGITLLHATLLSLDESYGASVVRQLLDAGCDPFARAVDGQTPLCIALDRKFSLIADNLLATEKLPPPDAPFAIMHSALPMEWKAQTIFLLVTLGIDPRELSDNGDTLLHATALTLDEGLGLNVISLLVDAGCDPSARNRKGKTILHIAVDKGYTSIVEYILSLNRSLPDDILLSLLKSHAAANRLTTLFAMLISGGANTRFVAKDGNNLLHVAISSPSFIWYAGSDAQQIMNTLIHSGCNIVTPNSRGITPLHLAVADGNVVAVECLLSVSPLPDLPSDILACALDANECGSRRDHIAMLQLLIGMGTNVHARDTDGGTLIHHVLKRQAKSANLLLDVVEFLVDSGCDASQCDDDGYPPVYFAVLGGHVDVVKYLLPRTTPRPNYLLPAVGLAPLGSRYELGKLLSEEDSGV